MKHIFAKNLKRVLEEKQMNQSQLSIQSGITPQSISKYCNGSSLPDLSSVSRIARVLEVTVDSLLGIDNSLPTQCVRNVTIKDYLRDLVRISDALCFQVTERGLVFNKSPFSDTIANAEINSFYYDWARYRNLWEKNRDCLSFDDYYALVSSRINKIECDIEIEKENEK